MAVAAFAPAAPAGELPVIEGRPPLQQPNRALLLHLLSMTACDRSAVDLPSTATTPADWTAVLDDPASVRGQAMWIRGRYAGRQRAMDADGVSLTEWGVIVHDHGRELAIVVYLPRRTQPAPPHGSEVAGVARFLGLWDDVDGVGTPRRYPVLVAQDLPAAQDPAALAPAPGHGALVPWLTALAAALALAVWVLARHARRVAVRARGRGRRAPTTSTPRPPLEGVPGAVLPMADPAESLARLAGQARAPVATGSNPPGNSEPQLQEHVS